MINHKIRILFRHISVACHYDILNIDEKNNEITIMIIYHIEAFELDL